MKEILVFPTFNGQEGLTLRDYFAAQAMQGLITSHPPIEVQDGCYIAYQWADEMLKQRIKQQSQ